MRLLNRLNQFQRLWSPSQGQIQQVTVAELATRCYCSERHIRTLLRQLTDAGWLSWQASSGRGKRGTLTFLATPQEVRASMMESVLNKGQQQNALELAQLAPEQLRQALQPFLGGHWQNDTPTLRIPYYRPLDALTPGFLPGRAEQHLASQVFAGLTRFDDSHSQPQPDLAHHWTISADGLCWQFVIRSTLFWHNGEKVTTDQLRRRLQQLLTQPAMGRLFASVKKIDIPHPWTLRFLLHRPDRWLAHRLASYCSGLAHPDDPQTGCGPWRITRFGASLVRLEAHDRYHLQHPFLAAIEYWITPQLFDRELGTSCRHPVQIAIGQPEELVHLRPVSNSISLGFCYMAIRQNSALSVSQAKWLMALIHHSDILNTLPLNESLITPSASLLPGWPVPEMEDVEPVPLPETLTLLYHLPVELHIMAQQLRLHLERYGCRLEVLFHPAKTWEGCQRLAQADIVMGDRLIGESAEYTLEQWLRSDTLWPHLLTGSRYAHLQATLDAVQSLHGETSRCESLASVFSALMEDAILTPLFNYRYQISAPPGVNGIMLNARGWFDFNRAWLPPPEIP
ncbi:SgrR family transcriptional regulator [Entomohabitans teleogrylli]|uniref:SgrR family transcriptional regulator n=1 Tax=Entomohabitans teleogrylli TaxID=1384589 RepID=UPI00073D4911|nr:SgrR family transcriptional regulator [Entomohabitans teleogrylli]